MSNLKTKPFNLEEALVGKPCITRGGKKVTEIVYMSTMTGNNKVLAVSEGCARLYNEHGKLSSIIEVHELDLLMVWEKWKKKSIWVNVYYFSDIIRLGSHYNSKEEALESIDSEFYIKTIEITNENETI
jgi:hypothetical protein